MRHLLEPYLVNDPFGDPLLYVDLHDERIARTALDDHLP